MADACRRCGGSGWWWDGQRRRHCPLCKRLWGQHIPDPVRDRYHTVSREEWPAELEKLRAAARNL